MTKRDAVAPLRAALEAVPGVPQAEAVDVARSINAIADAARDLDDIFGLLVRGGLGRDELADLLSAFESTLEQIRGRSDMIDGKLYEWSDRAMGGCQPA